MRHSDDAAELRLKDASSFAALFDTYHTQIWRFLYRMGGRELADEMAGEVFAAALASRHRFDPSRGSVEAWLYGIAANQARSWLRRSARQRRAINRLESIERAAADIADSPIERTDERLTITTEAARTLQALNRLPQADREILVLYAWEELSYEQIAAALDVAVGTVRSRLSRARRRLRELVDAGGEVPSERKEAR